MSGFFFFQLQPPLLLKAALPRPLLLLPDDGTDPRVVPTPGHSTVRSQALQLPAGSGAAGGPADLHIPHAHILPISQICLNFSRVLLTFPAPPQARACGG